MNREKSNSITHLVKIVAKEVVEDLLKGYKENILEEHLTLKRREVANNATNAGEFWTKDEDDLLETEVLLSMLKIAKKHNRTLGSIRCRIQDKLDLNI